MSGIFFLLEIKVNSKYILKGIIQLHTKLTKFYEDYTSTQQIIQMIDINYDKSEKNCSSLIYLLGIHL